MSAVPDDDTSDHEYASPIKKFEQLPPTTRRFLESLREEDIKRIEKSVRFYNTIEMVGRFNAWLILGIMTTLVTFAAFGEGIRKILGWMASGGPR
jgi:hypothetical protein